MWPSSVAGAVDVKKLATVALVAVAATIGCAPAAKAITGNEQCNAMHWPMPLPPTVGYSLEHLINDSLLACFDNIVATAPDGHDAMNDPASQAYTWKITSMTPPAGTMVPRNQKINLTVVYDSATENTAARQIFTALIFGRPSDTRAQVQLPGSVFG